MSAPSISFADDIGAAVVTSITPRLLAWTPDVVDVGPQETALGTGDQFQWVHRTDYIASFKMSQVIAADLPLLMRLKRWLLAGGDCDLAVNDPAGNTYTCTLAPGTTPTWELDPEHMRYTLSIALKNTFDEPLEAIYEP